MSASLKHPPSEYRLLVLALAGTVTVRVLLLCFSLRTVRRMMWRVFGAQRPLPERARLPINRVVRCVARATRISPVPSTCLVTALVAEALLQRHGYVVELKVGVQRPHAGTFAAHAWLESEGKVVVGGPVDVVGQYTPLPKIEQLFT